jgi:chromosome segregation ATPase
MSKEMYNIEKADNVARDAGLYGGLRVLFREELIGVVQNYSDANDVIEEHAANYKPTVKERNDMEAEEESLVEELSQEVVYEREILHLEEKVMLVKGRIEYLTSERSYWKDLALSRDDQQLFTQDEVYKQVDEERLRAWKENKAFQYDLAEQNAQLRKQLTTKHDDNARLQRQLAEGHNKLREAYTYHDDLEESTLSAQVRMSNAEVKVDDLTEENAILRRQVERYEDDVYKRQHDMYANSK